MMGPGAIRHTSASAASVASQTLQPLKTKPTADGGVTFQQALAESSKSGQIASTARQFESLMIGQMLKASRESSGGGWLDSEDDQDDQTGSMVMEMGEQAFAQAMAAHGGLGIAKMVTTNLERGHAKSASSGSAPAPPSPVNTDLKR